MEAVILIGIQGSGKSTFFDQQFAGTHVRISLDLEKTRRRERDLLQTCLDKCQPFVVDNTNVRASDRAGYIAAARQASFRVKGYFFESTLQDALRRNRQRSGRAVIPTAGVAATLKRLEPPALSEGFDELYLVKHGAHDEFVVTQYTKPSPQDSARYRIFLLSPANAGGVRGKMLLRPGADFDLAARLRRGAASLGEVHAFISGLYFRGKLAYAQSFAVPPPGVPGSFVITGGHGLVPPETPITLEQFQYSASIPIDSADARYRLPLERDCRTLDEMARKKCDFVLLGSVATLKYLEPLFDVFQHRLLFPEEFAGRGDMSRGGLMLRCAHAGVPLTHVPLGNLTRHGPRPPKLPRIKRT